jgi:hypothetical protein
VTRIYNRSFRAEDASGNPISGAQVTLWDTKTGAGQLTDGIQDLAGGTIAGGVLTTDTWGYTPDFQDTMDRADVWAIGSLTGAITGVERVLLESSSDDTRISSLESFTSGAGGLAERLSAVEASQARSVKSYGATGDGTTDDRAAIQAAIDAAAAVGGTVYFGPGVYIIGDSLVLKSGVTLQGSHGSGWPFRFPSFACVIMCSSTFAGECAISMLGADITGVAGRNEGGVRIFDLDISGERLPAGSVSGIHAQGEVMDVRLARMSVVLFTHNGIHTNVGTGTKAPHDWDMDAVVCYHNSSYGFSLSMTDGWIRDCVASSNGLDGWLLGPLGSLTMVGCQALFNTQNGATIAGGNQVGNVSLIGYLTDRNGRDGLHLGSSAGAGSPYINMSAISLNRDGKNGGAGGAGYAGLRIDACANPVIINGLTVETGVDDDSTGTNSPQYGIRLTGANAYVQVNGSYLHGDTAGWNDDGATLTLRRFNVDEASGPKGSPTLNYGNGVVTEGNSLSATGPALGLPRPAGQGLIAWTLDPAIISAGKVGIAGTLYLAALYVPKTCAPTKLFWGIGTGGASPVAGQNFVGLYNATGTLLTSVNVDASVTAGNTLVTTTIAPGPIPPGMYWAAFLFNCPTTMPAIWRGGDSNPSIFNAGVAGTPATMRFATNGTLRTSLPASITPSSNASAQFSYWAALG